MIALSIDTSANYCSVALSSISSGDAIATISRDIGRGHAELLIDIIEQSLHQVNLCYQDIDRVITTTGPGSFNGLRIGIATARAIGLALSKPVIGISNFQACAKYALQLKNYHDEFPPVWVMINARRNSVYLQKFQNIHQIYNNSLADKPVITSFDDLIKNHHLADSKELILCGSGAAEFLDYNLQHRNPNDTLIANSDQNHYNYLSDNPKFNSDKIIIHHQATAPIDVVAHLGLLASPDNISPEPLYLRQPDAKLNSNFRVLRCDN